MLDILSREAILCWLAAFAMTAIICKMMIKWNIADIPNERSSHDRPIPRGGGVAIIAGCVMGFLLLFIEKKIYLTDVWKISIITVLGMAVGGFIDDVKSIKPLYRFGIQFILSLWAIQMAGLYTFHLPFAETSYTLTGIAGGFIALLWIVGYINAYNFMDGLNGLSAGTAIINCLFLTYLAYLTDQNMLCYIAVLLAISCGVFLVYNFPKAKLFLGDSGSYFIGSSLALMGLIFCQTGAKPISPLIIPILFFHYIFDTAFTLGRRLLHGKNVSSAHREHLYQLLQQTGWTHARVSILYWLMAIAQGMLSLCAFDKSIYFQLNTLAVLLVAGLGYSKWVLKRAKSHGILNQ